ncbi:MAG TPA: 1,4-dihydroxy-2-naphthoate polyprenyltransferase [Longimicrobiales bacterium]
MGDSFESTPRDPMDATGIRAGLSPIAHRPSPPKAWLLAVRPKTLPAAVAPVLVGSACAYAVDRFAIGPAIAALIGALLLQIASNLANDVIDYRKGLDTHDRLGPTRVVQAGLLSERAITIGLLVVIGLALLVGVYLTWAAGIAVIAIGIASILTAIAYTGGPYPLGYNGLGDVAVFVFFGFVAVCGTAYVQALRVPEIAWWAAVPVGALATAILVVNNLRDIETDARGGKRTLAVRLGRRWTLAEYRLLAGGAYLVPVALLVARRAEAWVLLPLLTLPLAALLMRRVARDSGRDLNGALAATAQLLFLFSALFAAGIALSR